MPTTLGQVLDDLVEFINDPALRDPICRSSVRRAIKWFERNYSLAYMRGFSNVTFAVPEPGMMPTPIPLGNGVKTILEHDAAVFRLSDRRTRWRLRQISYDDFVSYGVGRPQEFYLVGASHIMPVQIPNEEYKGEIPVALYTDVDFTDDAEVHWLFDHGEDFVVFKAATYVAGATRDAELRQMAAQDADTALKTLLDADYEMDQGARLDQIGYAVDLDYEFAAGPAITGGPVPPPPDGDGSYWADGSVWADGSFWDDGTQ